jgi:hypothetical protein
MLAFTAFIALPKKFEENYTSSYLSLQGKVAGFCEHCNGSSRSMKCDNFMFTSVTISISSRTVLIGVSPTD